MAMFLILLLAGFATTVIAALLFAQLAQPEHTADRDRVDSIPDNVVVLPPGRFFAGDLAGAPGPKPVPVEALLRQIEHHIRLEQAAAESFLDVPSADSLHSPTASPFVN